MNNNENKYHPDNFEGFDYPESTNAPNYVYDFIMPLLTPPEWKVLSYLIRRTYGFTKAFDDVSIGQMVNGMVAKDGTVINLGTGLAKSTVARALNELEKKGYIVRQRNQDDVKGYLPSTYGLKIKKRNSTPLSHRETRVVPQRDKPLSHAGTYKNNNNKNNNNKNKQQQDVVASSNDKRKGKPKAQKSAEIPASVVSLLLDQKITKSRHNKILEAILANIGDRETSIESYVSEKIAYLEFLKSERPEAVKRSAAWLVSALQGDYSAPDGYRTPEEREAEKRRATELLEYQEQTERDAQAQREQERADKKEQFQTVLIELREQHKANGNEGQLWEEIVMQINARVSNPMKQSFVRETRLVSAAGGVARLLLPSKFAIQTIGDDLKSLVPLITMRTKEPVNRVELLFP